MTQLDGQLLLRKTQARYNKTLTGQRSSHHPTNKPQTARKNHISDKSCENKMPRARIKVQMVVCVRAGRPLMGTRFQYVSTGAAPPGALAAGSSAASGGFQPHTQTHRRRVISRRVPARASSYAAITCLVERLTSHHTCSNRICTGVGKTGTQERRFRLPTSGLFGGKRVTGVKNITPNYIIHQKSPGALRRRPEHAARSRVHSEKACPHRFSPRQGVLVHGNATRRNNTLL